MHTYQTLRQKVHRQGIGIGEQRGKWPPLAERKGTDVVPRSAGRDGVELVERRCAQHVQDKRELMVVVAAGEQGLPGEHLREDTPDGPYVDRLIARGKDTVSTDAV